MPVRPAVLRGKLHCQRIFRWRPRALSHFASFSLDFCIAHGTLSRGAIDSFVGYVRASIRSGRAVAFQLLNCPSLSETDRPSNMCEIVCTLDEVRDIDHGAWNCQLALAGLLNQCRDALRGLICRAKRGYGGENSVVRVRIYVRRQLTKYRRNRLIICAFVRF